MRGYTSTPDKQAHQQSILEVQLGTSHMQMHRDAMVDGEEVSGNITDAGKILAY